MKRYLSIFAVCLCILALPAFSQSALIEAPIGHIQEWGSEEVVSIGNFDYSVKLIDMPNAGPDGPRSKAWFGLASLDDSKRFLVVFVNTPHGEGIKYGYEYTENGKTKYVKALFNHVPLNRVLSGTVELREGGEIVLKAAGVEKILSTNLSKAVQVMGATSATVEFFPEQSNEPNQQRYTDSGANAPTPVR
jgi:hypothetical protein